MSKLQKLQCDCCGGRIDGRSLSCQNCGMQYRIEESSCGFTLGRVEVYNGKFITMNGLISVPAYTLYEMGPEKACEITIRELADRMAPHLIPFMEFQQSYDIERCCLKTCSEIRIAEPRSGRYLPGDSFNDLLDSFTEEYKRRKGGY